jgi:WD40 repeat protein
MLPRIAKALNSLTIQSRFFPRSAFGLSRGTRASLWNPEIDQQVATLSGHSGWVWSIAFAGHNALVSGSRDGTLKIWRALTWGEIDSAEKARVGINR